MKSALLLIGHGSKDPEGNDEFAGFARAVQSQLSSVRVANALLEYDEPLIPTAVESLVREGVTEIDAIPYFLFAGGHVKRDIPEIIAGLGRQYPHVRFRLGRHLGVEPQILRILNSRLKVERNGGNSNILLVGRGSLEADAVAGMGETAGRFRTEFDYPSVDHCFIALAPPDLPTGLRTCLERGARRIAVMPYFLFTGVLVKRIRGISERFGQDHPGCRVAWYDHLGIDPDMVALVIERWKEMRTVALRDPVAIEDESFRIIEKELGPQRFSPEEFAVVRRAIHSTADFEFARTIRFHPEAIRLGVEAIRAGRTVVADVEMVQAGINKAGIKKFGGRVVSFMSDPDVAEQAKREGVTRAIISMRKAAEVAPGAIYAIGNAPTALLELIRLAEQAKPSLVVGVPVGFVSAADSKEALAGSTLPYITALGRKGGTPVAVSIMNALIRLAG